MSGTPSREQWWAQKHEDEQRAFMRILDKAQAENAALSARIERLERIEEAARRLAQIGPDAVMVADWEAFYAALGGAAVEGEGARPRPKMPLFDSGTPDLPARADAHFSAGVGEGDTP